MEAKIEALLHPRVVAQCKQLYEDEHFVSAAREAMVTVEVALCEKSGLKDMTGTSLVNHTFGGAPGVKLVTRFGDNRQSQAAALFRGAFMYYRNYAAHDGEAIDERICLRTMIVASELLELLDASRVSYSAVGGAKGLVQAVCLKANIESTNCLSFCMATRCPTLSWTDSMRISTRSALVRSS